MHIQPKPDTQVKPPTCQNIDWYHEGKTRVVQVNGVQVTIRFIGRKGRRGRILVEAPAGAVFQTEDERNTHASANENGT